MDDFPAELEDYIGLVLKTGTMTSAEEITSLVQSNTHIVESGSLEIMKGFIEGHLTIDQAFTLLDSSKSLAAKNLIHRKDAERSGLKRIGAVVSMPKPETVAGYLQEKPHDTAILSFHVIGNDRIAIFLARNVVEEKEVWGIPGVGEIYYDMTYIDGVKPEFLKCAEDYAHTLVEGKPDFQKVRELFDFIGTTIFMLLWKPRPPREVIFIPHKLFNLLPLHALSVEDNGERLYLHDYVETISYASCIQELVYGGAWLNPKKKRRKVKNPRYLSVFDYSAGFQWLEFERKNIDLYRAELESKGVRFDIVTDPEAIPTDFSDYIWINWSSHSQSSAAKWGDSFLQLGALTIDANTIVNSWNFNLRPVVILAACESAVDPSRAFTIDEYCGLDMAFRISGARAALATLWPVEDLLAALTAVTVPSWWFQGHMTPDVSITGLQRFLRTSNWKDFLLREEQVQILPDKYQEIIREVQEPLWNLPDEAFASEESWAVFRCHGR